LEGENASPLGNPPDRRSRASSGLAEFCGEEAGGMGKKPPYTGKTVGGPKKKIGRKGREKSKLEAS